MEKYVVVGAGAAGLTLAYYLCRAGLDVTVLEREESIGGLARSFRYGSWCFDIGPHRFYSTNPKVNAFLQEVSQDKFLEIPRVSSVFFMDHYHDWPLRLSTVFKLPPLIAFKAGLDMLFKNLVYAGKKSDSFKDYVLKRYGNTLYKTFFKDYTEKFVGMSTENTHKNWAKTGLERATIDETVNTATLFEIFKLMLVPKNENLLFLYPPEGGIQSFWNDCADAVRSMGGRIVTGCHIEEIACADSAEGKKKITELRTSVGAFACDRLYWSGSVNEIGSMLGLSPTGLDYRAQIICSVMLDRPPLQQAQWCYYGAKDLIFSRISNPGSFAPLSVPEGKGGLCIEITCQYQDEMWNDPDSLFPRILKELKAIRAISEDAKAEGFKMERIREAYPIYRIDYGPRLDKFESEASAFENLAFIGRTGRFWYNNMDHSIENAQAQALTSLKNLESPSEAAIGVINFLSR
ncbi:FAD-dependent oxidoreductase [bacterium]|nr:FAD-dependent oxidoreductase [bacterium]